MANMLLRIMLNRMSVASVDMEATPQDVVTINPNLDGEFSGLNANSLNNLADAVCVNMSTGGHSFYTNYKFDEFLRVGTRIFGIRDGVTYELTGETDNGTQIEWAIVYPISDFEMSEKKGLQDVYVYMRSNGDVEISTFIDDEKLRSGYYITHSDREGIYRRRILLPKGIIGTAWQVVLSSVDGSSLELNSLEVQTERTQRIN